MNRAHAVEFVDLPPLATSAAVSLAALPPPNPALLGPIAPGAVALIRGPRGAGKSWLALAMAHAIANGRSLLGWESRPAPVLYIEAAMSSALLGARLRALGAAPALQIICDERLDLTCEDDQARLLDALPDGGLLVLDGLALVTRPGREAWDGFARWLRMLRRAGHAVVLVEPTARPALAALADTLITLKPRQGEGDVSFAVEMASRLGLPPADRSFVADLALSSSRATWTRSSTLPVELAAVIEAARSGGTVRDIAATLGLPLATTWRRMDKARALGLLDQGGETGGTPDHRGMAGPGIAAAPGTGQGRETRETPRTDLSAVSTAVLKRTLARRSKVRARTGQNRPGPAILAGYDDAELAAECARRKPFSIHATALAAE